MSIAHPPKTGPGPAVAESGEVNGPRSALRDDPNDRIPASGGTTVVFAD